jgi:RNA polymerase sigma factor (sigma-70 family)
MNSNAIAPEEMIRISKGVAKRYFHKRKDFDDLVSAGLLKIVKCKDKYKKVLKNPATINTFLYNAAKCAMIDYVRNRWIKKGQLQSKLAIQKLVDREGWTPRSTLIQRRLEESPMEYCIVQEHLSLISHAVEKLDDIERDIFNHVIVGDKSARGYAQKNCLDWRKIGEIKRSIHKRMKEAAYV